EAGVVRSPVFLAEDVLYGTGDDLAVAPAAGLVPARQKSQARQAGDGDVAAELPGAPGAVGRLLAGQVGQALIDGHLGLRRDHALGQLAVRRAIIRPDLSDPAEARQGDERPEQQESQSPPHDLLPKVEQNPRFGSLLAPSLFGDGAV